MSKVILAFEDDPRGKVNMLITHVDGFNTASNAHRLSSIVKKFLDEQCASSEVIAPEPESPEVQEFAQHAAARNGQIGPGMILLNENRR